MNKQIFQTLSDFFNLGDCFYFTKLNHQGQHIAWLLQTELDQFFVKQIQRQRYDQAADQALLNACETSANHLAQNHSWVWAALMGQQQFVFNYAEQLYLVYPWLEGEKLNANGIRRDQAEAIGYCLAQLHQAQLANEPHLGKELQLDKDYLLRLQHYSQLSASEFVIVEQAYQRYQQAQLQLDPQRIISHRDLHVDNVLWQHGHQPILIDWESTGIIHPLIELFGVAINWAGITTDNFIPARYHALIHTYQQQMNATVQITQTIIDASLVSWLAWLDYCLSRDRINAAQQSLRVLARMLVADCLTVN